MDADSFLDARLRGSDDETRWWLALAGPDAAAARRDLFQLYAAFARNVARRIYRQRDWGDIERADLEQAAYVGLLDAIGRFDPFRGVEFRSYAASRIAGAVVDAVGRMNEMREQISWRHRVRSERVMSLREGGGENLGLEQAFAALAEIAVGLAVGFMLEGSSLYRADEDAVNVGGYESAVWKDLQSSLQASLSELPGRERSILSLHYIEGIAFEQIALVLEVSKGRISQLHRSALARLNKAMRNRGHFKLEQ